jgi:hypothetical protein
MDQRREPWAWHRCTSPFVDARGVLRERSGDSPGDDYHPFEEINLPNALAKVADERSAVRFASTYGLLGYADMELARVPEEEKWEEWFPAPEEEVDFDVDRESGEVTAYRIGPPDDWFPPQVAALDEKLKAMHWGDPLNWVLAQGRTVRLVIDLLHALQEASGDEVEEVIARHRLPEEEVRIFDTARRAWESRPTVVFSVARLTVARDQSYDVSTPPLVLARDIVVDLVESNIGLVHEELVTSPSGGFATAQRASGLAEAIWWHVRNWAVSGGLRKCALDSCRTPFFVADERQRYCPSDYTYRDKAGRLRPGRSRCAALAQKRKERGREAAR